MGGDGDRGEEKKKLCKMMYSNGVSKRSPRVIIQVEVINIMTALPAFL